MELKDLSTWDWNRVYEKRPDLKKVPEPPLDLVIVKLLVMVKFDSASIPPSGSCRLTWIQCLTDQLIEQLEEGKN